MEVALAGQTTTADDLHLLRAFRDQVLARSTLGQSWVALYEDHRVDVALLLMTDDQLRAQARSALTLGLPLIRALIDADTAHGVVLTNEHTQAAKAIINRLAATGDSQHG